MINYDDVERLLLGYEHEAQGLDRWLTASARLSSGPAGPPCRTLGGNGDCEFKVSSHAGLVDDLTVLDEAHQVVREHGHAKCRRNEPSFGRHLATP